MDNVRAEGQAIIDRNTPAKVDVAQVLDSRFNANAATGEISAPNEPEMPPPSDDDDDSPF